MTYSCETCGKEPTCEGAKHPAVREHAKRHGMFCHTKYEKAPWEVILITNPEHVETRKGGFKTYDAAVEWVEANSKKGDTVVIRREHSMDDTRFFKSLEEVYGKK